jgi:hypothetical protein
MPFQYLWLDGLGNRPLPILPTTKKHSIRKNKIENTL